MLAAKNYMILSTVVPQGVCRLDTIANVPDEEKLKIGEAFSAAFPRDASFSMRENRPRDIRLADSLFNISSVLVVSERFKLALEAIPGALAQNELLPVTIKNHKGRAEKAPYFVVNQLDYPACIDEVASKGTRLALNKKKFQFMQEMVLDEALIPKGLMLFRPAQFRRYPLVRRELAEALSSASLTGVEFREIAGYEF